MSDSILDNINKTQTAKDEIPQKIDCGPPPKEDGGMGDISQIESLVVEDNPALVAAVHGYMSDRQVLIGRIKNLSFNYTKYSLVLEEIRKDIATIDQRIFDLIGRLPEIEDDSN